MKIIIENDTLTHAIEYDHLDESTVDAIDSLLNSIANNVCNDVTKEYSYELKDK